MSDKKTHYTYADIGKELFDWGFKYTDIKDAAREMAKTEEKASVCLLAYLTREQTKFLIAVQPLADALESAMKQHTIKDAGRFRVAVWLRFNGQVDKLVKEHGPCPAKVYKAMESAFMSDESWSMDGFFKHGCLCSSLKPPLKGSEAQGI